MELGENLDPPHPPAPVADDSLDVNLNLGTHNEELVSNRVKESSNYIGTCVELVGEDASNTDKCDQDMQVIVQQEEHPVDSGIKIDNCQVSQYSDAPDVAVDEVHHGAEMYVRRWISLREYIQDEVHGVMPDPQDISG
jgi:hypothetical protein